MNHEDSSARRVLVCESMDQAEVNIMAEHFEVDVKPGLKPEELEHIIGHYHAVVVGNDSILTKDAIEKAENLITIGRIGKKQDNIDIKAVREKGIRLINGAEHRSAGEKKPATAESVAEQIFEILWKPKPKNPLSLMVVPLNRVFPHEKIDPRRVKKLSDKLKSDRYFKNPPIVVEAGERYVVLDGATRTTAFRLLGYRHIIVQAVDDKTKCTLDTWFHAIRGIGLKRLYRLLKDLPEITMREVEAECKVLEKEKTEELCCLMTTDQRVYQIHPAAGVDPLKALNRLTEYYIENSHVARSIVSDIPVLKNKFKDLAGLVVFPKYSMERVLNLACRDQVLPAGITRFIIPGRVMHLNADLEYLKSDEPLDKKNIWLDQMVLEKMANEKVRYYEEPIYLLDE